MQQTNESNHLPVCYRERVVQLMIGAPAKAACRHLARRDCRITGNTTDVDS